MCVFVRLLQVMLVGEHNPFMGSYISNLAINKSLGMVQCAHLFDISLPFLLLFHRYGERITLNENAYIICAFKVASGRLWLVKCTEVQQRQSREKEKILKWYECACKIGQKRRGGVIG